MSEWFDVTDQGNVDLSDDGKEVHILFATNRNGNRYVSVPVELLVKLLATQQNAHLTPESLASSQAVSNASAVSQSDSDTPPAQAQVA